MHNLIRFTGWPVWWVIVAGLWLAGSPTDRLCAQAKPPRPQATATLDDRSPVRVRYPDAGRLRDLQTSHDYQYDRDTPPPESPLASVLEWLLRKVSGFLSGPAYKNVWQYVVLAAIVALVFYLLSKAEVLGFLFPKKAADTTLDYENLAENIHEINFETAIGEAVEQRNYRLAVRLLYLQTLRQLSEKHLIAYRPQKTNRQYVYELAQTPGRDAFENLTRQFEFVWYGDFPVDEARFAALRDQFRQFQTPTAPKTAY